jgi:cytosine deaminase
MATSCPASATPATGSSARSKSVPSAAAVDLLLVDAVLPDGRERMSIACRDGRIESVERDLRVDARRTIDAHGQLVAPPFVDAHFHMDSALTYGTPRVNRSGTLLEGIQLWGELKPALTHEAIRARALEACRWAVARGTLVIRSHVDVCDPDLRAVKALVEVRALVKDEVDLQLVAFPQDGYLRWPAAERTLAAALDLGVDVVGGIPHFERTMADGAASIERLCRIAAERRLLVDVHCDESDDPSSRHVEVLARETVRQDLQGRVTASHLTAMHSMDNYYVSKLIPLMREAGLTAVANPLINITLQGRHDTYPKRRGMTRVKELLEAGVNVACGHDCVMDPWYPLGSHDMLDVAHMAIHVGHLTGVGEMRAVFDCVTVNGARALHRDGYGLDAGCWADMVLLQARSPIDAIRLRPARLAVIRRGRVIAETPGVRPVVTLAGKTNEVDFHLERRAHS